MKNYKISLTLDEQLFKQIENYRVKQQVSTEAEAITHLLKLGAGYYEFTSQRGTFSPFPWMNNIDK